MSVHTLASSVPQVKISDGYDYALQCLVTSHYPPAEETSAVTEAVRVRFAPSPTGFLHIGGARTALYNWAYARHHGGTFVLRIEDTDPERSTAENTDAILRALRWLGLDWDEGPEVGGDHGPYFQTQRFPRYLELLEELKASGHAYPCFCSPADLEEKRNAARERGGFAGYDRTCRDIDPAQSAERRGAGEPHVWRLKVPADRGDVIFDDAVRGEVVFPPDSVDDFVLARTDGSPTYNFAVVADDVDMKISHVIRGDDHLSNTPKQIVVYEALGLPIPVFAHLSMILGADGKRLSKRHGATSVEAYRDLGFIPEALMNYLALLGWSLDGETTVIDSATLCENFELDRISKNPAIFDEEKLEWLNGVYLRDMPAEAFVERMAPWLTDAGLTDAADIATRHDWFVRLAPLLAERTRRLDEVPGKVAFLFAEPVIDDAAREKVLLKDGSGRALSAAVVALQDISWSASDIEAALRELPEQLDLKAKAVFQAIRVAATGSMVSPPLFESLELLGREVTVARLEAARPLAAE
jgi:glutamyl-tRNA synthetase